MKPSLTICVSGSVTGGGGSADPRLRVPPLPGTRTEVEAIAALFGERALRFLGRDQRLANALATIDDCAFAGFELAQCLCPTTATPVLQCCKPERYSSYTGNQATFCILVAKSCPEVGGGNGLPSLR